MKLILETERLVLREFNIEDAPFVLKLLNSPGWLKFIGDRNIKDIQAAKEYITDRLRKPYKLLGYGFYLMQLKNGDPIGMCGLIKRDYLGYPDIGFALLPGYEGKGYGFEAAQATAAYAKEKLNLPALTAITTPKNQRSIALLSRIGLKETGTVIHPESQDLLLVYTIHLSR